MTIILLFIGTVALYCVLMALAAWPTSLLWNWIVPILWPAAPLLTTGQMWGLLILCQVLLGGPIRAAKDGGGPVVRRKP